MLHCQVCGAEPPLIIGMELSYPPFEMVCPNGDPCGISVDITNELGRYLHRDVQILNMAFVGLIPALKSGKIDLIISSLTITPERMQTVDFSIPYAQTGLCLLINRHSAVRSQMDLNKPDVKVVVKLGTVGEQYASSHLTKATVRVLEKENMCVLEVVQGKADVFLYDQLSVYRTWQRNQNTTLVNLHPFNQKDWGIAVRKGNKKLLGEVNAFIQAQKKKGEFKKLGEKYLPEEIVIFEKLDIPFVF